MPLRVARTGFGADLPLDRAEGRGMRLASLGGLLRAHVAVCFLAISP